MQKQEAIMSELYAIKAGLSVISNEADKLKSFQDKINGAESEMKSNECVLQGSDSSVPYNQKRRSNAIKGIVTFSIKLAIRILIVVACFVGAYFSVNKAFGEFSNLGNGIDGVTIGVSIFLSAFLPVLGLFVLLFPKLPPKIRELTYSISELKGSSAYLSEKENKRTQLITRNEELAAIKQNAQNKLDEQLEISLPLVRATYDCLLKNYQNYIKECDFENVDLVIHYIYSGRALDVRDALLQTDAHIRHNEILEVFEREARAIRTSIDNGFAAMTMTINTGFRELSSQLEKQHREGMERLGNVGHEISSSINNVASAQSIQNAYSAKIEKNSRQLAKDANEMLGYMRRNFK